MKDLDNIIIDNLILPDCEIILDNINNNECIEIILTYCKAFTKIPKYMVDKEQNEEINLNIRILNELFYSIKLCNIKSNKSNKLSLLLMDKYIDVYSINEDETTELLIHTDVKRRNYKEALIELLNMIQKVNTNIVYNYKKEYILTDSFKSIIKQIGSNIIFYEDTYISNTKVKEEINKIED
jgi:hypothetical protein